MRRRRLVSGEMKEYNAHVQRAAARASAEIAKRAALYRTMPDAELRAVVPRSPWERTALQRVLRERKTPTTGELS